MIAANAASSPPVARRTSSPSGVPSVIGMVDRPWACCIRTSANPLPNRHPGVRAAFDNHGLLSARIVAYAAIDRKPMQFRDRRERTESTQSHADRSLDYGAYHALSDFALLTLRDISLTRLHRMLRRAMEPRGG